MRWSARSSGSAHASCDGGKTLSKSTASKMRSPVMARQIRPRPYFAMKLIESGVAICAAIVLSEPPDGLSVEGWRTLGVTLLMALWWLGGVLPIAITAVAGATLMIVFRCLSIDQAYRAIEWKSVFLIACMIPLGSAMNSTGAAAWLAEGVAAVARPFGPWGLIIAMAVEELARYSERERKFLSSSLSAMKFMTRKKVERNSSTILTSR